MQTGSVQVQRRFREDVVVADEFANPVLNGADCHLSPEGDIVLLDIEELVSMESPRVSGIDLDHTQLLADLPGQTPPIWVHRGTGRVVDGMHRVAAARLRGESRIRARYLRGTVEDAFLWAVRVNVEHGLPLNAADRRAAASRIIDTHPHLSDRRIARIAGLAPATVGLLRAGLSNRHGQSTVRIGEDGRAHPLNAVQGRLAASRIIKERPEASLREIAREAGISVGTARDVRLRLAAGQDPVPERNRGESAQAARHAAQPRIDPSVDVEEQLKVLRRDPALRYTDSGRTFLQWLSSHVITVDEWRVAAAVLPTHCGGRIAAIARECSLVWARLADEAETA